MGAAGDGCVAAAARADYARAAAAVLADGGHAYRTFELAGDASFTLPDPAAYVSRTGRTIAYDNLSRQALHDALIGAGTPELFATILSDTDAGIERGALFDEGRALSGLIGRPTVPFQATIETFLAASETASPHG